MNGKHSIIDRAKSEWERYVSTSNIARFKEISLGLYGEAPWATDAKVAQLSDEGYRIATGPERSFVSAKGPRGLLYGTYAIMNASSIAGNAWVDVDIVEDPTFKTRLIWSWERIDNTYRHSPYMKIPSLISSRSMSDPESSPEMMRFIRNIIKMRANSLAITHELHHKEIAEYDQHGFRPYYEAIRNFSTYLKTWGIDLYLYTAATPEPAWQRAFTLTDCPYNPDVRLFFGDFIDEINAELPDIQGLYLAGGLGGYARGNLSDCKCSYCAGKSLSEKLLEQIGMVSSLLGKHDKNLIYTITTDIPFNMKREVDPVLEILERIPANTILTIKDCYHDFEELRYPEHPLFGRIEEKVINNEINLATEYQLFPEMRGKGNILSNTTERWGEIFRISAALKFKGVVGVVETHPDKAHPSMADWYAWGRYSWNPEASADQILKEWALMEYPRNASDTLVEILKRSFVAAGYMLYAGGVQCGIHGMIIPFPYYVRDIVNDTWCLKEKLPEGIIGNDNRHIGIYTSKRDKEISNDPKLFLFNSSVKVDKALKEKLLIEKSEAIRMFSGLYEEWRQTRRFFEEGDYRYEEMSKMLKKNVNDAKRFYAYFKAFLDWQSGDLTLEDIESIRNTYIGTADDISLNTSDELLGAFLRNLGKAVQGIEYDKKFNAMCDLPQYEGKIWQESEW